MKAPRRKNAGKRFGARSDFPQPRLSLQKAKEKTVEKARKKVAEMKFGL
jgi:hypothetical protein